MFGPTLREVAETPFNTASTTGWMDGQSHFSSCAAGMEEAASSPMNMQVDEAGESEEDERKRFSIELQFVQVLANPRFLHCTSDSPRARARVLADARGQPVGGPLLVEDLAQEKFFENKAFVAYLGYLRYWKRPEYVKYVTYPHCLFMLDMLQNEHFRRAMLQPNLVNVIYDQQFYQWKFNRANRLLRQAALALESAGAPPAAPGGAPPANPIL
jgi:mediator of RNA polymerase II transcription subunit 31